MMWGTNGTAIGKFRELPQGYTEIAPQPVSVYVLNETWANDPMDPNVAWRPKTTIEKEAEKDAEAAQHNNTKRSAKAQSWINYDYIKDPLLYATKQDYWAAVRQAYRDQPWNPI